MGIKSAIVRAAGKAGDAIAKVSSLSPGQLEKVEKKREEYLALNPDPSSEEANEQTSRLLATCGVEIHGAYLPQLKDVYVPIDQQVEYEGDFDTEHNIRSLAITRWVSDPKENSLEKLASVYESLSDEDCNIALIFNRTRSSTNVYLSVVNARNASDNVSVNNLQRRITESLQGNFPGTEVTDATVGVPPCLAGSEPLSVACISNIPSEKSEKDGKFLTQTIEKLLDGIVPSRRSEEYTLVLLASPARDLEERKLRLAELYTALFPFASWQTNHTFTQSDTDTAGAVANVNAGINFGHAGGGSQGQTHSENETDSTNDSVSDSEGKTESQTAGESVTDSTNTAKTEGTGTNESASDSVGGYLAGSVSGAVKPLGVGVDATGTIGITGSHSSTIGTSKNFSETISTGTAVGKSVSETIAKNLGRTVARGVGKAVSRGLATTSSVSKSASVGANFGVGFARSSSVSATVGTNEGVTQSFKNYSIDHALTILAEQSARLDQASALGIWDFAAYVLCEDHSVASNVAHSYLALTQGAKSHLSRGSVNLWRGDIGTAGGSAQMICSYVTQLRHPLFALNPELLDADPSFAVYPTVVNACTALSGMELAYSLNFPRKSVPGLPVLECASFGRSVTTFSGTQPSGEGIQLGKIFHMRREEPVPVKLSKDSLASHAFVTGSTGSGKTNTVCRILDEAVEKGANYLVIEPAKGEYKSVYGMLPDVSVFGTNPDYAPLLKVNPFSFPPGIHVLEHLDRLVEVFNVCWPMYAAMPAVLKNAVERSYEDCGWNLLESRNPFGDGLYPTFSDVCRNVKAIIDSSEYDDENKGAYKGSLLTRLQSLSNGLNGLVLSSEEIDSEVLFDSNVIIDLSRVGSSETKSLLMGLLVLKLQEHRMAHASGANQPLRHLTVLEEAHTLLREAAPAAASSEGGSLQAKSVEMLANAIAEMRTYGEGFIIADQAPGLLDKSVIRNTNTKIVMRLPDLEDRELVGRAANLNDQQIAEVARLPQGVAAVYQNDWVEPVLCKVAKSEDGSGWHYERPIEDEPDDAVADKLVVATALSCGEDTAPLAHTKSAVHRLSLCATEKVAALKLIQSPDGEPRITKLAPLMAALFPEERKTLVEAVESTNDVNEWTRKTRSALERELGDAVEERVLRVIIQSLITDYVLNERGDEMAYKDWYLAEWPS